MLSQTSLPDTASMQRDCASITRASLPIEYESLIDPFDVFFSWSAEGVISKLERFFEHVSKKVIVHDAILKGPSSRCNS